MATVAAYSMNLIEGAQDIGMKLRAEVVWASVILALLGFFITVYMVYPIFIWAKKKVVG